MTAPPLSFRHVWGLKASVSNPLIAVDDNTVLFACGHQLVLHNTSSLQQRFIPATDMNGPHGPVEIGALALSPNRRFVAVAEVGASSPVVSIFDVRSLKRRRLFASPAMQQACVASQAAPFRALVSLAFSADSRHLAAVSCGPEAVVLEWQWQKEQLTACGLVRRVADPRTVSYHPTDASLLMVSGEGGFSLLQVDWDSATISAATPSAPSSAATPASLDAAAIPASAGPAELQLDVSGLELTCHTWLDSERCLLGARQGLLLLAQHGRLVAQYSVLSSGAAAEEEEEWSTLPTNFHPAKAVHSLCAFPGGGAVAVGCDGGLVQLYTAAASTSPSSFPLRCSGCHVLPHQPAPVVHVALSCSQADVLAVTDTAHAFRIAQAMGQPAQQQQTTTAPHSQQSAGSRPQSGTLSSSAAARSVAPLLSLHHSGAITGLSLCVRKPLAATCGADRSIRLWNLLSLQCELVVYFPEVPLSVSFHPSGLQLLVGFSDKLRLCSVLSSEIRAYRELPIKACMECAFSHGGHAFACVNGTLIQVYDTHTGEQLAVFRGHTGPVRSLAWSADDLRLVSAGLDGAVYQRRLGSAGRMQELVQKGCKFTCALVTEHDRLYAVGDDRLLKEIVDRSVNKTLDAGCVLTCIAVDHQQPTSRLIAGTDNGVVRSFAFPLTGVVKDYQCHSRCVTRLAVSHDDRFVVSTSEDGSIALFNAKPNAAANSNAITSSSTAAMDASSTATAAAPAALSSTEPSSLLTLPIPLSSSAALASPDSVVWSDDVLVSRASLDEASHLLVELRSRVDELSASNDYQLRLHEMNYSEKVKEMGEKYGLQLEHDRSRVELMVDEKQEMEAECNEKLRQMKDAQTAKLQQEDRGHQQTLMQQIADYASRQEQMEEQQRSTAAQLQALEEQHRLAMERLSEDWQVRVQQAMERLAVQRRAVERVRVEYSETKSQTCSDQDAELEAIKAGYSQRLLVERDSLLRFKGEVGIMKKKLSALHKDIEEQKELLKQSTDKEEQLTHSIHQVDSRIAQQRASMREKDRMIGESERAIAELKKDNGELEKFKFVLDYQIKQLKRQIEPREAEIAQLKTDMSRIDSTLERDHSHNKALQKGIAQLQHSNAQLQAAIHRSRDHTRQLSRRLQHAKATLSATANQIADVERIAATLHLCVQHTAQLHSEQQQQPLATATSLTHKAQRSSQAQPTAATVSSGLSAASPGSVLLELARHRASLLHRVADLGEELSSQWREGRKGTVAVMHSNMQLIHEIQSTRRRQHNSQHQRRGAAVHRTRTARAEQQAQRKRQQAEEAGSERRGEGQLGEQGAAEDEEAAAAHLTRQRASIVRLREQILALTAVEG